MIKIINYFLQSIFVYLFFFLGRILGLNIGRKFFANFFLLIGPFFKSSKTVQNNLNIVSYNLSPFNKKKITESMWKNYGMTFIEYVFLSSFRKKNSHIIIKKEENLKEIIEENEPVIFISGHFANFELMSMEISKKKIPLATIYRPLNNIFINPFMEYLRKKYVCKNQIKKGIKGVRDAINFIQNDHSIALMIDQRVSEGEKTNFFDYPALTTTLPAQLAYKYKLNLVPVFIERIKNNNFKIKFYKEIDPNEFNSKIELTKKLNNVLENMIRKNPGQWIWTHNRWK